MINVQRGRSWLCSWQIALTGDRSSLSLAHENEGPSFSCAEPALRVIPLESKDSGV
jgi:hypothetical protein